MSSFRSLPRDAWLTATARGQSILGDEVAYVALAWRLKGHGPGFIMALALSLAIPQVLISPWAGLLADRLPARRLVSITTMAQALVCVALVWTSPLLSVVCMALLSLGSAIANPAMGALVPRLVPAEELPQFMGLASTFTSLGAILGPAVGGTLVAVAGTHVPLVLDAASFAVYAVLIRLLKTDRVPEKRPRSQRQPREWAAGWRVLRADPVMATLLTILVFAVLGIGAINVAEVFFITQTLHGSSLVYGILGLTFGGGNLVGALLFPRLKVPRPRRPLAAMLCSWSIASGILIFGVSRTAWMAAVGCLIVGIANGTINMLFGLLMADRVPDEVRGRFGAVFGSAVTSASITSMVAAGALLPLFAPETILTGGGVLAVVACGCGLPFLLRALRREAHLKMPNPPHGTTISA